MSRELSRGQVRWYTFRAPDKRRPVLILTRQSALSYLNKVTVAPLTTTIRDIPSEVFLTPEDDGVLESCVVNFDNIQTVSQEKVGALITSLSAQKMREASGAIQFVLELDLA